MIVEIDGYALRCHKCGVTRREVEFDLGYVHLWANAHGRKFRLFCHRCGYVYDVTIAPDRTPKVTWQEVSMKCAVWKAGRE